MSNNKSVESNIVTLILLSVVLKGIGFVNRMVIAYFYGTTSATDIYYNVSGFVESISAIILSGLTVGIINLYIENKDKNRFISNILIWILLSMVILMLVCGVFSNAISALLAPSYNGEMHAQMATMMRMLIIVFPFQGALTIYSAVLQANNKFVPVKLTGTLSSIVSIICVVILSSYIGINALVVSFIVGIVLNTIFLRVTLKNNFRFKPLHAFKDLDVKKMMFLVFPLIVGTAGHEINLIIDKSVASQIMEGAISALSYSCVLYLFIENIVIQSIVTAIFPDMMEKVKKKKEQELAINAKKIIIIAEILIVPIVICTFFNSTNITKIVYMRGSFGEKSLALTSAALMGYVLGLPFLAVRDIITRIYYAYSDTKAPVIINLISVVINIILDFVFGYFWGIMGITLSTSVSNAFSGIVMIIHIQKYNKGIINLQLFKELGYILFGAILSSIACYFITLLLMPIVALIISVVIVFAIELIILYLFKSKILFAGIGLIKEKIRRK